MRKLLIVLAAVGLLLVACSGGADGEPGHTAAVVNPTDEAAGNPTDEAGASVDSQEPDTSPSAAPAKPSKPVVFSGKSSKKTKPFNLKSPARIDMTHTGSANFIVTIYETDNTPVDFIANDIGKVKATTWVYGKEGKVYFDVLADGKWTIKVTETTPPVKQVPVKYQASYSMTTTPFEFNGDVTVSYTHKGKANFIVTALDAESGNPNDIVVNEIGRTSGDTQLYGLSGTYAFNVTADGAWTLVVRPA